MAPKVNRNEKQNQHGKRDLNCESGKRKRDNEKEEKKLRSECLRRPHGWLGHLKLRKSSQTLDRGSKVEEISAQNSNNS